MIGGNPMSAYTNFAKVYDEFMDNIPYETWADYIYTLLQDYHISTGLMLDLGCGTGTLTNLMADKGFDMIGLDNSIEMLEIAREKSLDKEKNILYLLQDMREFELYGTVSSIISVCDSLNYILDLDDLTTVFQLANNYLDPKGIFIFDFKTEAYYKNVLGENIIAEDRDTMSFIWDNYYDEESKINEYLLSLFIQNHDNLYEKFVEEHYQRAYSIEDICTAVKASGLEFITCYDAFTKNNATSTSERIYVVARECGKTN